MNFHQNKHIDTAVSQPLIQLFMERNNNGCTQPVSMEKTVLIIVAPENYSGLGFITLDVILKENAIDLVVASIENSTARADDGSSTMTVSFAEVRDHISEYAGVAIVCGGVEALVSDENLKALLKTLDGSDKPIAVLTDAKQILDAFQITGNNVHVSDDDFESFAEKIATLY